MGGGIGQWLLFRAADRSLSLFSLVVPCLFSQQTTVVADWTVSTHQAAAPGERAELESARS
jgi:hypothetical protein